MKVRVGTTYTLNLKTPYCSVKIESELHLSDTDIDDQDDVTPETLFERANEAHLKDLIPKLQELTGIVADPTALNKIIENLQNPESF